ncbi:MAG: hypothetical protein R3321_12665, partial [Nitrososphaeraceae archaeon]|nr:hypothetical protein [Nitrososphaeraceae archaeon]
MAEVIPAILEKEFPPIQDKLSKVENLVDWVQIDIADGELVDNKTFLDPTPFKDLDTSLNFELHMMVKDPLRYLERYAQAGFMRFFAHVEGDFVEEFINKCYQLGVEAGLAIDGPTKLDKIKPYLDNLDCVLVMAIKSGFSGQPYREDTTEKIAQIRKIDLTLPIAVDGAMNLDNAKKV